MRDGYYDRQAEEREWWKEIELDGSFRSEGSAVF